MIKCIFMCGKFSLSLLELLFGKIMDEYNEYNLLFLVSAC